MLGAAGHLEATGDQTSEGFFVPLPQPMWPYTHSRLHDQPRLFHEQLFPDPGGSRPLQEGI